MSDPLTHTDATSPTPDRAANGQFGAGNKFGRGNPFARQMAALRATMMETVTHKDLKEMVHSLMIQACAGDVASCRLIFQYILGKPQPAPDPDRLDIEEMRLNEDAMVPA